MNSQEALLQQLSVQQEELRTQNAQLVEAQGLLHDTLAEYTDLYDHAPVGFVTLDATGLISRMNFAAEELIKARRERLAGLAFHQFVKDSYRAAYREHLRRCRAGESRVVTELVLVRSDGREVPAELISRPAVGNLQSFRTVIIDLTERKRGEARTAELTAELERRTSEAEQHAARLKALAAKLVEAENTERRRLARNLHDHLQQELIAAKYCLAVARGNGQADDHGEPANLCDVEEALDRCLESSRQITADLTPPPLQQGAGLPAALRWLADRTAERHGLHVTVTLAADGEPAADTVRTMLYEVTRELLLNVVKHAGVSEAAVSLSRPGVERLRLSVSDEGRGFEFAELLDRADFVTGLGLFGLRERVENLGGTVEIRSGPGNGTTVTVEVPDVRSTAESHAAGPPTEIGLIPR
jgi:PAS domain S-box-containing protein